MALFYTRCLQDLPKITVSDVHRLVQTTSSTRGAQEKKVSTYIYLVISTTMKVSYTTLAGWQAFYFYFYPESTHRYMLASSPCRCLNCADLLEPEVLKLSKLGAVLCTEPIMKHDIKT